jgi:DNA-binding transcriptional regulator YhcF (GntR family)
MQDPIHNELAKRIEDDFLRDGVSSRLPSIRAVANHYGVSYRTAWNACRQLDSRQKAVAQAPALRPSRRLGDAARELAGRIAESIRNGEFRAGVALPKFDYFVLTHRVTRKTVAAAFARLSNDNLVHKDRRRWQSGPRPDTNAAKLRAEGPGGPPVILWVLRDQYSWFNTFNSVHLGPFIYTLRSETARMGILLSMRLRYAPPEGPAYLPSGLHEARLFVKRMGSRYLGAIIMEITPEQPEFVEWVKTLSADGARPVVYFDSADLWPGYTREALGLHDGYFRFFHDESSAVDLALSHLTKAGHRCIGFPVFESPGYDWSVRRFDAAARSVKTMSGIKLVRAVHHEPIWDVGGAVPMVDNIATFIQRLAHQPGSAPDTTAATVLSNRRRLIEQTPSMKSLLDQGITALISMNDRIAYEQYWWCQTAGIHVPRRLSQISFDHMPEGDGMPITTIDFGFSRLGYLAAHAVIGDIKVKADRIGNIAGIPILVDRGSVTAPAGRG